MKTTIKTKIPDNRLPWHTVSVSLPVEAASPKTKRLFTDHRQIVKNWVLQIAKRAGLSKRNTRVNCYTLQRCYRGFIFVYRGAATPGNKKLLAKVLKAASSVTRRPAYILLDDREYTHQLNCEFASKGYRPLYGPSFQWGFPCYRAGFAPMY